MFESPGRTAGYALERPGARGATDAHGQGHGGPRTDQAEDSLEGKSLPTILSGNTLQCCISQGRLTVRVVTNNPPNLTGSTQENFSLI